MIYIKCDEKGEIVAVGTEDPESGAAEQRQWIRVDDRDPRLQGFCRALIGGDDELMRSDAGFIRVLEDVIDLLVERSVIMFTDLPPAAQEKLMARRSARARLRDDYSLLDEEQGLI